MIPPAPFRIHTPAGHLPGARLSEGDFRHSGKWPRLPDRAPLMRCDGFIQTAPDCSAACGTIRCPATHPFGLESNLPLGMGSMLRCRKNKPLSKIDGVNKLVHFIPLSIIPGRRLPDVTVELPDEMRLIVIVIQELPAFQKSLFVAQQGLETILETNDGSESFGTESEPLRKFVAQPPIAHPQSNSCCGMARSLCACAG